MTFSAARRDDARRPVISVRVCVPLRFVIPRASERATKLTGASARRLSIVFLCVSDAPVWRDWTRAVADEAGRG